MCVSHWVFIFFRAPWCSEPDIYFFRAPWRSEPDIYFFFARPGALSRIFIFFSHLHAAILPEKAGYLFFFRACFGLRALENHPIFIFCSRPAAPPANWLQQRGSKISLEACGTRGTTCKKRGSVFFLLEACGARGATCKKVDRDFSCSRPAALAAPPRGTRRSAALRAAARPADRIFIFRFFARPGARSRIFIFFRVPWRSEPDIYFFFVRPGALNRIFIFFSRRVAEFGRFCRILIFFLPAK